MHNNTILFLCYIVLTVSSKIYRYACSGIYPAAFIHETAIHVVQFIS